MGEMGQAEVDSRLENMRAGESLRDIEAMLSAVGIPVIDGRQGVEATCAASRCRCTCDRPCVCIRP